MNELLDHDFESSIRAALTVDAERGPSAPPWEGPRAMVSSPRSSLRWVTVAASVLVVATLGALTFLVTRSGAPGTVDGAPTPETTIAASGSDPDWTPIAVPAIEPRSGFVAVQTDTGWFVWGGYTTRAADNQEISKNDGAYFDNATGTWTALPTAPISNDFRAAYGVWTGAEVVVVVANDEPRLAAFDPVTFQWRDIPVSDELRAAWPLGDGGSYSRGSHRFAGGKFVMFFPNTSTGVPVLLVLDLSTGEFRQGAAPPMTSDDLVIGVAASSDQFFVAGAGQRNSDSACTGTSTPLFTYDITTDTWNTAFLPHGNWQPAFIAWTGNALLAGGGRTCGSNTAVRTSSLYDPVTDTWNEMAAMTDDLPFTVLEPLVSEGRVIVAGESGRPSVYYLDSDAWWSGPALFPGRTVGDLHLASFTDRLVTWSAGAWERMSDGSLRCCEPEMTALELAIPTFPQPASTAPADTIEPTPIEPVDLACATGVYLLVEGDTPRAVATKFDIKVDELTAANVNTPGFPAFAAGTSIVIPYSGSSGCGAAIAVHMGPTASAEQVALVRDVLRALDSPFEPARNRELAGVDGAVTFLLFADELFGVPASEPIGVDAVAAELKALPMVAKVDVLVTP